MSLATIMPNYPVYDQDKSIEYANRATQALGGIDSSGNFQKPMSEVQKHVDQQAIPGHQQEQLAIIENLFHNKLSEYNSDTAAMVILNDLANVNKFANATADSEMQRLQRLRMRATSDLMKSKTDYMQLTYAIDYQKFQISLIQVTFFFIILLVAVLWAQQNEKINWYVFGTVAATLAVLYIFIVAIMYKNMLSRRKDDWNKYYFWTSKNA
jgi:hypothetical protein